MVSTRPRDEKNDADSSAIVATAKEHSRVAISPTSTSQTTASMPANAPKEASLSAMPAEVFESIARFADKSDLPALRLVDRECNSKALRTFTKAFFSTIPVLLCYEKSIDAALEVAKHPVFGRTIATLDFCIDFIPHESDYVARYLNLPVQHPKTGHTLFGLYDEFEANGQFLQNVVDLLKALHPNTARSIHVTAGKLNFCGLKYVCWDPHAAYLRLQSFKRDCGICIAPVDERAQSFDVIIKAIATVEHTITSFTMDTGEWGVPFNKYNGKDILQHLTHMSANLECVHLTVECGGVQVDKGYDHFQAAAKTIASAKGLKTLSLSTSVAGWKDENLDVLLRYVQDDEIPLLETLILKGVSNSLHVDKGQGTRVSVNTIRAFAEVRSSLRRLEMNGVNPEDMPDEDESVGDDLETELKRLTGIESVELGTWITFV